MRISKKLIVPAVLFLAMAGQKASAITFTNPLGKDTELDDMIDKLLGGLLWLAIIICPVFILWGAFLVATSGGDQEKTKKGRQIITYAAVGLLIMALSGVIKTLIYDLVIQK